MKLSALTFGFGALSAVIPFFNMEAFIAVAYAQSNHHPLWLAFIGSLGQNSGKLVWFYVSRSPRHPLVAKALGHAQASSAI